MHKFNQYGQKELPRTYTHDNARAFLKTYYAPVDKSISTTPKHFNFRDIYPKAGQSNSIIFSSIDD